MALDWLLAQEHEQFLDIAAAEFLVDRSQAYNLAAAGRLRQRRAARFAPFHEWRACGMQRMSWTSAAAPSAPSQFEHCPCPLVRYRYISCCICRPAPS